MFVCVGETGDSDYEDLLSGTHKTIILKDCGDGDGSQKLLRGSGSYSREDVVPLGSPNIVTTESSLSSETIHNALRKFIS